MSKIYTKYTTDMPHRVKDLVRTIRSETDPVEGHDDPGAIEDCWNSLQEMIAVMSDRLQLMDKIIQDNIRFASGELEMIHREVMPTAYNLTKGKLNGYLHIQNVLNKL